MFFFSSRFSGSSAPSHELLRILVVLGGGGTKQRYKMNEHISDAAIQYAVYMQLNPFLNLPCIMVTLIVFVSHLNMGAGRDHPS